MLGALSVSQLVARGGKVKQCVDVPVRRVEGRCQLCRTLEMFDRRVKVGTLHQGSPKREVRVRGGDVRWVAVFDREGEGVSSEPLRRREIAGLELDERKIGRPDRGRRKAPCPGKRPRFCERCPRLVVATLEEERLPQRHEPRVSPGAPFGLMLEHEHCPTLSFGDPPSQEQRPDHRDPGAKR